MPELAGEAGFNSGVSGRAHGGIDEMWMQSEPRWPRIILAYIRQREVKRAPQIAIPSGGRPRTFIPYPSVPKSSCTFLSHSPIALNALSATAPFFLLSYPSTSPQFTFMGW